MTTVTTMQKATVLATQLNSGEHDGWQYKVTPVTLTGVKGEHARVEILDKKNTFIGFWQFY